MKYNILPQKYSLILLIILLGASCFSFENQNGLELNQIPFKLERDKVILRASVAGIEGLNIILDTGMSTDGLLLYKNKYIPSLKHLANMEVKVPGAGAGNPSSAFTIDTLSFKLENIEFKKHRITVLNDDKLNDFPSDGVTGYSLFGHHIVEINYDERLISLHESTWQPPDDAWQKIPLYFKKHKIPWIDMFAITVGFEEVHISVYIDLASSESVEFLTRKNQKFKLPDNLKDVYLGRGLSGDIYGQRGRILSLRIGQYKLKDVEIVFAPAHIRSKQINADAVLSNNALRRFNIVFDYQNQWLYIKPNKFFNEPF